MDEEYLPTCNCGRTATHFGAVGACCDDCFREFKTWQEDDYDEQSD